jgi:hypothetical protein
MKRRFDIFITGGQGREGLVRGSRDAKIETARGISAAELESRIAPALPEAR